MLSYMTLSQVWLQYLSMLEQSAGRTAAALRSPRPDPDRQNAERSTAPWTDELREFYTLHDGQERTTSAQSDVGTALPELWLLGVDEVVHEHHRCRQSLHYTDYLGSDWPSIAASQPAGTEVDMFLDAYIPFATTGEGDYLFIDTRPGEHHGCVREYSLEFADIGGPLFPSLTTYLEWLHCTAESGLKGSTPAPRIDENALLWTTPARPPTTAPVTPARMPLYIPFDLIEFLPSEVGPDDDVIDLDVVTQTVLDTARSLHPGAAVTGGQTVYPRVPRRQGINMNCFTSVDGEQVVYFTVVTGVGNEVLVFEHPPEGFELVDETGAPIVPETPEQPVTARTFTHTSFDRRNAPLRTPPVSRPTPQLPDLHLYDWVTDSDANGYLFDAYCLTLIPRVTIAQFLQLLPTTPTIIGECDFATLDERGIDVLREDTPGGGVGLVELENGVMMFEPNGYVGISPSVMGPVSVGRTIASHYRGGHGVTSFHWYVDGQLATGFEPFQPSGRDGEQPDALVPLMQAIGGFHLDYNDEEDDDADEDFSWLDLPSDQATFTLTEILTGIPITLDLIRQSTYLSLDIPIPDQQ